MVKKETQNRAAVETSPPTSPPSFPLQKTSHSILSECLRLGSNISVKRIAKNLNLAPSTTREHLQRLRDTHGFTFKDDKDICSVWVLTELGKAYLRGEVGVKSSRVGPLNPSPSPHLKSNQSRGHGFQIKFILPHNITTKRWLERKDFLKELKIKFEEISLFGGGQKIQLKGHKIHLTNKSIIIYSSDSFIRDKIRESNSTAIDYFKKIVHQIEDLFNVKFRDANGLLQFKVTRSHFALINNALARQFNSEKRKLEIYNHKGLCYLIDDSFRLKEFEVLQNKATHELTVDTAEKVQNFVLEQDRIGWVNPTQLRDEFDLKLKYILKSQEELTKALGVVSDNLINSNKKNLPQPIKPEVSSEDFFTGYIN